MDKKNQGRAYIMVVIVSLPIMFSALTALTISVNSRNLSARHSDFFGMYELASAANIYAILVMEEAYLANREAAHISTLLHFEELTHDNYHESVICLVDYAYQFRSRLLLMIWSYFEDYYGRSGTAITRQFEIKLGTDHVFYGTMTITQAYGGIKFLSVVTQESDNILPIRARVRGIVRWPTPQVREVYLEHVYQIKNLDYFTPWVVELMRK